MARLKPTWLSATGPDHGTSRASVPSAALRRRWATDPADFGQVGCVSANKDPDFRSRIKVTGLEFGRLIRNVYKVLLTRGMVGTVIYSPDPETRDLLHALIG